MRKTATTIFLLVGLTTTSAFSAQAAANPNSIYSAPQQNQQPQPHTSASSPPTEQSDQGNITVIRLQRYKPLSTFRIPQGLNSAAIVEINNKIFVLDKQPDGRLGGLWIGSDAKAGESLCGYLNNSMNIRRCYQILYRQR